MEKDQDEVGSRSGIVDSSKYKSKSSSILAENEQRFPDGVVKENKDPAALVEQRKSH